MFGTLRRYFSRAAKPEPERAAARGEAARAYDLLLHGLADRLYRETLGRGGWTLEVGCFGPDLFLDEANERLHAIALGDVQSGPPTP